MTATFELFDAFKTRFGEQEARFIVKEIERIETSKDDKVEKEFERKKDILSTKEDIAKLELKMSETKVDIIKWIVVLWIAQTAAIVAAKFLMH